jgi:hypothetical protein
VAPHVTEILHNVSSPYFNVPTIWEEDPENASYEKLCEQLVGYSKGSGVPLITLKHIMANGLIGRTSITKALEKVTGSRPYTNICRAAAGLPINYSHQVRGTRFDVISSDAKPIHESLTPNMWFGVSFNWTWYEGKETILFESSEARGIILKHDREITEIQILHHERNIYATLLDIVWYCKAADTGFTKVLGEYKSPAAHFSTWFRLFSQTDKVAVDMMGILGAASKGYCDYMGNIPPETGILACFTKIKEGQRVTQA